MAVSLSIVSEFAGKGVALAIQQFKQLDGSTEKAAFAFKKLLIPGAIAATGAIVAFTKGVIPAVNAASDLEESMSKNNVIFGDAAGSVSRFADEAARALGQSKTQALAAASTFGTMGKAAGLAGQELATFSTDFTTLASDLASFNNTTPEDAIMAIGAALRGEAEPMRRYGVLLNDATLKQAAMELGIYKGNGALTAQQKVLAAQRVIYQQTTDAQGDFARTSDGLANQQRILAAQIDNLQAKIGTLLLPVFKDVVKFINDKILPAMDVFVDQLGEKGLRGGIISLAAAFQIAGIDILGVIEQITVGFLELARKIIDLAKPLFVLIDLFRMVVAGGDEINSSVKIVDDALADTTNTFARLRAEINATAYQMLLFNQAATNTNSAIVDAEARLDGWGKKIKNVVPTVEDADKKTGGLGKTVDAAAEKAKKMADRVKELTSALEKDMAEALEGAEDNLKLAQDAFDSFSDSVSGVISDAIDFAAALEKSGEEGGKSFFDELQGQADRAKQFGTLVEKLLAAGLSKDALDQVLAAGVESGSAIAQELLKSSENVLRANKLVEETQAIAARIGEAAAAKFYQAGVDNGKAYLRGVEEAIAFANARIAGAKRPADIKGAGAVFGATVGPLGTNAGVVNNYNITTQSIDPMASAKAVNDALVQANRIYGPLDIQIA